MPFRVCFYRDSHDRGNIRLMKYNILYAYALVVVVLIATLTCVILMGIGADWHGVTGGTVFITGVLCVASYNIIEVQKQLDSFRSILDHIEEYQAIPYKKRIDELEKELSILKDML